MADVGAKIELDTAKKVWENFDFCNQTNAINLLFKSFNDQKMTPKFFKDNKNEIEDTLKIWKNIISQTDYEIKNSDKLFLNYEFGSYPELDSINVLTLKKTKRRDPRKVFFNIETKSTKAGKNVSYQAVKKSLEIQLNNRIQFQLQNILNGEKMDIVSIGYIDGKYVLGKHAEYKMDKVTKRLKYSDPVAFKNEGSFLEWFKKYTISPFAEQIIENYSKSMLTQNVINNIKNNIDKVKFNDSQNSFFDNNIKKFLNNDTEKVLFVNAPAGSGKTVMATRTYYYLNKYRSDLKPAFLIMNQKFFEKFFSYDDSNRDYNKRISFGTNYILSNYADSKILIVDEAQRLPFKTLENYIKCFKKIILFGDERQIFMKTDELYSAYPDRLLNLPEIKSASEVISVDLKDHVRYSNEKIPKVINAFLANNKVVKKFEFKKFEINVCLSKEKFFDSLDKDYANLNKTTGFFHIYNSWRYDFEIKRPLKIGDRTFKELSYYQQFPYLSENRKEYIGNTQHAISFDVDNVYIYLPYARVDKLGGRKNVLIYDRFDEFKHDSNDDFWLNNPLKRKLAFAKVENQPYILMSRAIEKVSILVEDLEVFKEMTKRLQRLIKK